MKEAKAKPTAAIKSEPTANLWRIFLLLGPICWILYANSLGNQFVFDDVFTVVNNDAIRNFHLKTLLTNWFRPVRDLSLVIDYWLWGLNPSGFRLTNILLHSFNSCWVYVVAKRIVEDTRTSLMTALLFAVHPIQTDAVTYISGRRDVLFTFFYLLSFYSFIRFKEERHWRFAAGSLIAFALSMLTKEMAATLPVILLLWELYARWEPPAEMSWFRQFSTQAWTVIKAYSWLLAVGGLVLAGVVARYATQGHGLGSPRAMRLEYWGGSAWSNFLTVLTVQAYYLKQLVAPVTLVASYQGAFPIAHSLWEWRVILSVLILVTLVGLMVYGLRRDKIISFALAFYFITLLPVSQIIPHHELLAEHYLYLPMFGFALLIGHVATQLSLRGRVWKRALSAGFVVMVLALSARTIVRNRDWKDAFTLWQATYQAAPHSPRATYNLGVEYLKRHEFDQSISLLQQAIELEPSHILAHNNLAAAYLAQRKPQLALNTLEQALKLTPAREDRTVWGKRDTTYQMILRNMAKCYLELGQPEEAIQSVQRAIQLSTGDAASYALLASIYERLNQVGPAVAAGRQGLQQEPSSVELRLTLARLLATQGRLSEAVTEWQATLNYAPTNPEANLNLAVHSLGQDNSQAAQEYLRQALTQPVSGDQWKELLARAAAPYPGPRAFLLTAGIYRLLQQPEQAIKACRDGLTQHPTDRVLRLTLALLYVDAQNIEGAAAEWERVVQVYPNDYLANLNLGTYYLTKGDEPSAQRYFHIALANAPDEAGRQQVRDVIEQAGEHSRHSHPPGSN